MDYLDLSEEAQKTIRTEAKLRLIEDIGTHYHIDDVERYIGKVMRDTEWMDKAGIAYTMTEPPASRGSSLNTNSPAFAEAAITHFAAQSLAARMHDDPKGWDEDRKADYVGTIMHELKGHPDRLETVKGDYRRHLDEKLGIGTKGGRAIGSRGDVEADKGAA